MNGSFVGELILWLVVAVIVIAVIVYLLNWLYHRSTKEVAFVRTGLGGETVVINGGALVLPIVHEVTPVNLNVVRIPVSRRKDQAVISRDRMRVDIDAEFFVRVVQRPESVAAAASTLGRRTLDAEQLTELLSGKFVGALRSVAAEMSLDEMHEQRSDVVREVEGRAADALARNGLELEAVAITDLDQAQLDYFDPSNRFDAEGLTQLIDTIETRRRLRNDIEQSAMVAIRSRNLEAEKETLELERISESTRLDQGLAIEEMRAAQSAGIEKTRAERESQAETARLEAQAITRRAELEQQLAVDTAELETQGQVERARLSREQAVESARIERDRQVRLDEVKQRHEIDAADITANEDLERARIVSERQVREAKIIAEEDMEVRDIARGRAIDKARIEAHEALEGARIAEDQALDRARIARERDLRTAQVSQRQAIEEHELAARDEVERARIATESGLDEARVLAERNLRRIEIEREQLVELAGIERKLAVMAREVEVSEAEAAREAARGRAVLAAEQVNTSREQAVAERIAAVDRLLAAKDAETSRIAAEAERISAEVAAEAQRLRNEAENVLSEDARAARLRSHMIDRLEGIVRESVRPMKKIDGIRILHVDGLAGGGGGEAKRSPTDEVIDSALRYRAQAPLIDELMKEIGVEGSGVAKMGDVFRAAKDAQSIARAAGATTTETDD